MMIFDFYKDSKNNLYRTGMRVMNGHEFCGNDYERVQVLSTYGFESISMRLTELRKDRPLRKIGESEDGYAFTEEYKSLIN